MRPSSPLAVGTRPPARCAQERDFYFGKLRDIEILCQTHEDQSLPFLQSVLAILYQTEDDFVAPADAEGEADAGAMQPEPTAPEVAAS